MSITGFADSPPTRSGQSISDYYAGMLCAFSIVAALHYRARTGKGQRIDIALLDGLLTALDNLGERYTVGGEILTRKGNISFAGSSSGVYATTDGHVAIAAGTSNLVWRRFCQIIRQPELADDPKFATTAARRASQAETAAIIQGWTSQRSKAEVVSTLAEGGVPAAPVNNVAEMIADPQIQAREMFVELEHPVYGPVKITGTPLKLSETPGRVEHLAPLPGEHNEAIFGDLLGYPPEKLHHWQEQGVI
jgi:CoA:oxalate CoA-transferase